MTSLEKVAAFFMINVLSRRFLETLFLGLTCLEDNKASESGSVVSSGVVGRREGHAGLRAAAASSERFLLHSLAAISPEI